MKLITQFISSVFFSFLLFSSAFADSAEGRWVYSEEFETYELQLPEEQCLPGYLKPPEIGVCMLSSVVYSAVADPAYPPGGGECPQYYAVPEDRHYCVPQTKVTNMMFDDGEPLVIQYRDELRDPGWIVKCGFGKVEEWWDIPTSVTMIPARAPDVVCELLMLYATTENGYKPLQYVLAVCVR